MSPPARTRKWEYKLIGEVVHYDYYYDFLAQAWIPFEIAPPSLLYLAVLIL